MILPAIRRFLSLRPRFIAPGAAEHQHPSHAKSPPGSKILVVLDSSLDTEPIRASLSALRIAKLRPWVESGALGAGEDGKHASSGDVLFEVEVEVDPDLWPSRPYFGHHTEQGLGREHETHVRAEI